MSLLTGASGSIDRLGAALHWGSLAGAGHGGRRAGRQRSTLGLRMCEDGGGTLCDEQVERAWSGDCTPGSFPAPAADGAAAKDQQRTSSRGACS
jgi:hypothetical protein